MKAEIISIGEELLIGQTINSNSAFISSLLNNLGISVRQVTTIADDEEEILRTLTESTGRSALIMLTGGLGPTRDDVTKNALCRFFDCTLKTDEAVLSDIITFFEKRGIEINELNRQQALVPECAKVIRNPNGTAPGLQFEKEGIAYFAMPGVPFEMKAMMQDSILALVKTLSPDANPIVHKTILTQGIGESFLASLIVEWENQLPDFIQLAYLPSPGIVRLRLTGRGKNESLILEAINKEIEKLKIIIPEYIWGYDNETLEGLLGKYLKEKGETLCTAESCTVGYIAHRITSVSGSSRWFKGAVVAYSNEIKHDLLNIEKTMLEQHGAVSQQTVEAMAANAREKIEADWCIAISGIAGPTGGTPEKPVGTVWIAVAGKDTLKSRKFMFGDNRERNIIRSAVAAMAMLANFLQ